MNDLFDASIDGIALEMESIDDTFDKAIARYEYPFANGADLDDMGLKARTLKFRCHFWDNEVQETYEDHKRVLDLLKTDGLHELIHPNYGIIKGCIESVAVRHDDRIREAEIDISFVEQLPLPESVDYADIEAEGEQAYLDGLDEQADEFAADATDALGSEASGILARDLDPTKGILEQFSDVSLTARAWLKEVDNYVSTMEATLNQIANPANSLIATINYGTDLPGRVLGSVARCVERYATLYDSLKTAPVRFLNSIVYGLKDLENSLSKFSKTTRIAAASHVALQAAYIFKADEQERSKQKKTEKTQSFDLLGNYRAPEQPGVTLTANELEQSLAVVRGYLQEAIDSARQCQSLKTQAVQLLTHVNTVKLEREKIITVTLDNPLPLHLVCLINGLPYNAAERLMQINQIKNPNFTSGEIRIYAR